MNCRVPRPGHMQPVRVVRLKTEPLNLTSNFEACSAQAADTVILERGDRFQRAGALGDICEVTRSASALASPRL
jgi:hypothetical protein